MQLEEKSLILSVKNVNSSLKKNKANGSFATSNCNYAFLSEKRRIISVKNTSSCVHPVHFQDLTSLFRVLIDSKARKVLQKRARFVLGLIFSKREVPLP